MTSRRPRCAPAARPWRDAFVSVCGNDEMAEAVDLLGGDLAFKLSWMKEEGTDFQHVKEKLRGTADDAQKAADPRQRRLAGRSSSTSAATRRWPRPSRCWAATSSSSSTGCSRRGPTPTCCCRSSRPRRRRTRPPWRPTPRCAQRLADARGVDGARGARRALVHRRGADRAGRRGQPRRGAAGDRDGAQRRRHASPICARAGKFDHAARRLPGRHRAAHARQGARRFDLQQRRAHASPERKQLDPRPLQGRDQRRRDRRQHRDAVGPARARCASTRCSAQMPEGSVLSNDDIDSASISSCPASARYYSGYDAIHLPGGGGYNMAARRGRTRSSSRTTSAAPSATRWGTRIDELIGGEDWYMNDPNIDWDEWGRSAAGWRRWSSSAAGGRRRRRRSRPDPGRACARTSPTRA